MLDLEKLNSDFAVYLPALVPHYLNVANGKKPPQRNGVDTRRFNFFNQQRGDFYYPWSLYSAGHETFKVSNFKSKQSMVYRRNREKVKIVTDSAGYQIINDGVFAWSHTRKNDKVRKAILEWQIETGDIGVIIDVPLASIDSPHQPYFNSFEDCLEQTVDNIAFFQANGMDRHPFMNVIHGTNPQECDDWYAAVRPFKLQGWAFGGEMKQNFYLLLRQLVILQRNNELDAGKDWIHLFGTAVKRDAIHFTKIKRELRKHNPEMEVSFDTATPFQQAFIYTRIMTHVPFSDNWLTRVRAPRLDRDGKGEKAKGELAAAARRNRQMILANSPKADPITGERISDFEPVSSPILDGLTEQDIIKSWSTNKKGWDDVSYCYFAAHNVLDAISEIQEVNWFFDQTGKFGTAKETAATNKLNDIIERVLSTNTQNAMSIVSRNRAFLETY